MSADYWNYTKF